MRVYLRRLLGISSLEQRHEILHRHVSFLSQWVNNLDVALQELQHVSQPPDIRALATEIRERVKAIKLPMPPAPPRVSK